MAHCKKVFFMTMMVEVPVHFNRSMRQNEEKIVDTNVTKNRDLKSSIYIYLFQLHEAAPPTAPKTPKSTRLTVRKMKPASEWDKPKPKV